MGRRRRSREIALQVLFQFEAGEGASPEECFALFCRNFDAPREMRTFAWELFSGVVAHRSELDRRLAEASEHWRVERMSRVDRNILRLALYEMLYLSDIPPKVSLNEAIDLGKKYGSQDSGAFINGILDRVHRQTLGQPLTAGPEQGESS